MKFRLIYSGTVRPTQRDPINDERDPLAVHKHIIRREFHKQLKELWATNRFLSTESVAVNSGRGQGVPVNAVRSLEAGPRVSLAEYVASRYCEYGYHFVPLVREENSLLCSLDILFLRRDIPGSAIQAGDIDNRIKTLIDALRRPRNAKELVGSEIPASDETPFFCLLEDDSQVSKLTVETDTLLSLPTGDAEKDGRQAMLVITVELRPYHITMENLSFA
jgi:hypothetical protein